MHGFRDQRVFLGKDKTKIVILSVFFLAPLGFHFLTRSPVSAVLLGLISAIFLASALSDIRSGKIPNRLMIAAACLAVLMQMSIYGALAGLIRSAAVALLWLVIASLWHSRKSIGGGDLKMIGVTWLVFAVFPSGSAVYLVLLWAFVCSLLSLPVLLVMRKRRIKHFRYAPILAAAAMIVWTIGLIRL
jgi:Flp pilus assembly protein protease CpaA